MRFLQLKTVPPENSFNPEKQDEFQRMSKQKSLTAFQPQNSNFVQNQLWLDSICFTVNTGASLKERNTARHHFQLLDICPDIVLSVLKRENNCVFMGTRLLVNGKYAGIKVHFTNRVNHVSKEFPDLTLSQKKKNISIKEKKKYAHVLFIEITPRGRYKVPDGGKR